MLHPQHIVCHPRGTNDFAFMASSSLISAAGEANENRNVRIFDTLLPSGRSSVVKGTLIHCILWGVQNTFCAYQTFFLFTV